MIIPMFFLHFDQLVREYILPIYDLGHCAISEAPEIQIHIRAGMYRIDCLTQRLG